jgi:hypothetical protein
MEQREERAMIGRVKTQLLLFALLGFFAFVAVTLWLSAPEPNMQGSAVSGPPTAVDTLDTVLLLYADALAHVAQRYVEAESYETAVLLLKRVFVLRKNILGPDHPSAAEAQERYAKALRAQGDTAAGGGSSPSTNQEPAPAN